MQTAERERERGIKIRQATPERGSVLPPPRPPLFPDIVRVQLHRLRCILIPNNLAIASIKTTVHERIFFWVRTSKLEPRRRECEWRWRAGIVGEAGSEAGLDATQTHYVADVE